jgi:hypothetical protein
MRTDYKFSRINEHVIGQRSVAGAQIIYRCISSPTLLLAYHNHGCDLPYEASHFHVLHSVHYGPIITI